MNTEPGKITRIIASEECGNSPKNLFLKKLTIAFARGETEFILNSVSESILWNIIGEKLIQGKDDFSRAVQQITGNKVIELTIHHVVTHGKAGAVNGMLKLENGTTRAFCDIYEFSGAKGTKVNKITSYSINI